MMSLSGVEIFIFSIFFYSEKIQFEFNLIAQKIYYMHLIEI